MTTPRACTFFFALLVAASCLSFADSADVTPAQYGAELDRILAATDQLDKPGVNIPQLVTSLPTAWHIHGDKGTFDVSTGWLRDELGSLERRYDPESVSKIRARLTAQKGDLEAYEGDAHDISRQRATLSEVLSRPEFRDTHGPTWIDRLKQRLIELILRLLGRAITSSTVSEVGRYLVYGLMILAFLAVAYWVYRTIRATTKVETILPESLPIAAREWTVWLADARDAGRRGNWREAIHLAYWAGISFLESQGAWRPDAARTPREYLRLISAANERRPILSALTRKFELVWYAGHAADEHAFAETLEELEKLGCR
jgi:hypothetical protein